MLRYKKKPIEIDAFRLTVEMIELNENMPPWFVEHAGLVWWTVKDTTETRVVNITTLEGTMTARAGDWILKGVAGEIYPCKHEIFEKTYDMTWTEAVRKMQLRPDGIPRRCDMSLYTPAEKSIREAVNVVEAAGAHEFLTEAVILLQKAQEKVADYVERDQFVK